MSYYYKEEQETIYNYDPISKCWYIYSTYPPHIKRIVERVDNHRAYKDEEGRVIEVSAEVDINQVRLYSK